MAKTLSQLLDALESTLFIIAEKIRSSDAYLHRFEALFTESEVPSLRIQVSFIRIKSPQDPHTAANALGREIRIRMIHHHDFPNAQVLITAIKQQCATLDWVVRIEMNKRRPIVYQHNLPHATQNR